MNGWLMANEAWLKLAVLVGLLSLLCILQRAFPRRGGGESLRRWSSNLGLIAISTVLLRPLLPAGAVAFASWMQVAGVGLLNQSAGPAWLEVATAILLLDLAIYWQHRAFHYFPVLWRAHRVHHSDPAFDASLGVRFHPLEILPSMAFKLAVVALLGVAPLAIVVYEASLLGFSLFTHADVALSSAMDRRIRLVFVTPDWHRVHHSVHHDETNSNYGNILSLWDRLFRSYLAQPREGHERMRIGLPGFRDPDSQSLAGLLRQPFGSPCTQSTTEETRHA